MRFRPALSALALALVASACAGQLQTLSTREALERLNIASTKLYAADGTLIANLHGEINRDIVPLAEIPEHVQNAVIAIEDERFWQHGGVDARGITRAVVNNLTRGDEGDLQGASTISQQVVKNLYFSVLGDECEAREGAALRAELGPGIRTRSLARRGLTADELGELPESERAAISDQIDEEIAKAIAGPLSDRCSSANRLPRRDLSRKLREASLTIQLEKQYSKHRILEMYLNTVYLGRGAYGVEAASRSYFHKDAAQLTAGEGAFLAGLIKEPARYEYSEKDPKRDERLAAATARRNVVLDKMLELGFIDRARHLAASSEPLRISFRPEETWRYPYFVDMVLRQLGVLRNNRTALDPRFDLLGTTFEERSKNVYRGGLRIYTTLDPSAQSAAEEAVDKILPDKLTKLSASLAAVESGSGYIRAIVGGRNYYPSCQEGTPFDQQLPDCSLGKVNLALGTFGGGSGRQPGSSFKPFVLAAALERGISLHRGFDSSAFSYTYPGGTWKVGNYEGDGGGYMDLVSGTVFSVNAVYAHLLIDGVGDGNALKGAARVANLSRRLGIPFPTEEAIRERCGKDYGKTGACTPADQVPAIALGAKEVAPLDVAGAYAAIANEGVYVEPTAIVRITDAAGKVLYEASPKQERALPRDVALGISHVLTQVINRGTGVKARLGRVAAGKTGTSQEWRDAWFDGYVPQLAAAVWVGNPLGERLGDARCRSIVTYNDALNARCIQPESMTPANGYPFRVVGGSFPAMIWQYFMTKALADVPAETFAAPPSEFFVSQNPSPTPGPLAAVPDVLGRSVFFASAELMAAGFTVSETRCLVTGRGVPDGTVVKQTPAGGVQYPQGSPVEVCVSGELPDLTQRTPDPGRDRNTGPTTVPSVIGSSRARARAELRDAGLEMADVGRCDPSGSSDAGRVWSQSPGPGSSASRGSTVTVYYNPAGC